jgi:hypothetical protein
MKACKVSGKNASELFTSASFLRFFKNPKHREWGGNAKGLLKSVDTVLAELQSNKLLRGMHLKTTVLLVGDPNMWTSFGTFLDADTFLTKLNECAEHGEMTSRYTPTVSTSLL